MDSNSSSVALEELGGAPAAADVADDEVKEVGNWLGKSVPAVHRNGVAEKLVRGGFCVNDAFKWSSVSPDFLRDSFGLTPQETVRVRHALARLRPCTKSCFTRLRDSGIFPLFVRLGTLVTIAVAIVVLSGRLDDAQDSGQDATTRANLALEDISDLGKDLALAQEDINTTQEQVSNLNLALLSELAAELPPLRASLEQLQAELSNDTVAALVLQVKDLAEDTSARLTATASSLGNVTANLTTELGTVSDGLEGLAGSLGTFANKTAVEDAIASSSKAVTDALGTLSNETALRAAIAKPTSLVRSSLLSSTVDIATDNSTTQFDDSLLLDVDVEAEDAVLFMYTAWVQVQEGECDMSINIAFSDGSSAMTASGQVNGTQSATDQFVRLINNDASDASRQVALHAIAGFNADGVVTARLEWRFNDREGTSPRCAASARTLTGLLLKGGRDFGVF